MPRTSSHAASKKQERGGTTTTTTMTLTLYNTYGRKLAAFRPTVRGEVRMYTCGPTVYDYAHIGNFRTFVFEDVLRRYVQQKGYRVVQVKNITDVEDRIIEGIKRTGKSLKELTDFYTAAFMEDLRALNIQPAEHYPRATEFIAEIVTAVESLLKKGYAYRADDGSIYFSIKRFPRYGKLSGIDQTELKSGTRVAMDHYEKMGANDFALWKAWDPDDGSVFWETSLGKGRPGWHIECSVMSMKYLGPSFDIHTGGKDLKFPHHENEIAQSEALTGKRFVRVWLHSEFLNINGEKMSKSLGNIVTLRQLLERGWSRRAVRLFLISAHYRDELNLTDDSLKQAEANIARIDQTLQRLLRLTKKEEQKDDRAVTRETGRLTNQFLSEFERAMNNDLGTPRALASFFTFIRQVNARIDRGSISAADSLTFLDAVARADAVLGIMTTVAEAEEGLPADVQRLIEERDEARKNRDYKRADEIRELLRKRGIILQDSPSGTTWSRASQPS